MTISSNCIYDYTHSFFREDIQSNALCWQRTKGTNQTKPFITKIRGQKNVYEFLGEFTVSHNTGFYCF